MRNLIHPALIAAVVFASPLRAEDKIYKCGTTFQTTPCEGGEAVELPAVTRYHSGKAPAAVETKPSVAATAGSSAPREISKPVAKASATPKKKGGATEDENSTVSIMGKDVSKYGQKVGHGRK